MFPERDCLLSGQQSDTYSRLLYDGLTSFQGSARSSTRRPIQSKWKKRCFLEKSIRNSSSSQKVHFFHILIFMGIPIFISIHGDTYLYRERSIYKLI